MATILTIPSAPTWRRTQNFREVHFKVEEVVAPAAGILPEPEVQGVEAGSEVHLTGERNMLDGVLGNQIGAWVPNISRPLLVYASVNKGIMEKMSM